MTEYDDSPERVDELDVGLDVDLDDYEIVAYRRDAQQAEVFRDLLSDHEIEAILPEDEDGEYKTASDGIPVFVPVESADEAAEILAELERIEELDGADPDEEDDDGDDEDIDDQMQPLEADAYYIEDCDEEDSVLDDEEDDGV